MIDRVAAIAGNTFRETNRNRVMYVLLLGTCVKPYTKLQRQAAYYLARLYIFQGACYSAKNVWRMYAQRYKRAYPYRRRPAFPPCKLKGK